MARTTIHALVATTPRHLITQDGLPITSFRVCEENDNGDNNWFTVVAFRDLAVYASQNTNKGDRIIVEGQLKCRDWDNGEHSGTSIEIEAGFIAPDPLRTLPKPPIENPHLCDCDRCDM